jgi:hypothetical protein
MTNTLFDEIHNAASALAAQIPILLANVRNAVPSSAEANNFGQVKASNDTPVGELLDNLQRAAEAIQGIFPSELSPSRRQISELKQTIDNCTHLTKRLQSFFINDVTNNGAGRSISVPGRHILTGNSAQLNFGGWIDELEREYDSLIRSIGGLMMVSDSVKRRSKLNSNIASAVLSVAEAAKSANEQLETLNKIMREAEQNAQEILKTAESVTEALNASETAQSQAASTLAGVGELRSTANTIGHELEVLAKGASKDADAVKAAATQTQDHTDAAEKAQTILVQLVKRHENQLVRIDENIERANQMIAGATVAGLAFSFGEAKDKLDKELLEARKAVEKAIIVTVVLASPLWIPVLTPALQLFWQPIVHVAAWCGLNRPGFLGGHFI